jgi:hypothetical protein
VFDEIDAPSDQISITGCVVSGVIVQSYARMCPFRRIASSANRHSATSSPRTATDHGSPVGSSIVRNAFGAVGVGQAKRQAANKIQLSRWPPLA